MSTASDSWQCCGQPIRYCSFYRRIIDIASAILLLKSFHSLPKIVQDLGVLSGEFKQKFLYEWMFALYALLVDDTFAIL